MLASQGMGAAGEHDPIQKSNDMIPDWALEQNMTKSPIYVNDMYPFPNTLLRDGIYPNEAGEDRIGNDLSPLLTWIVNLKTTENVTISS
ncbi:hypothetical protein GGR54DRAFT_146443 [Hypoxylon sp. NC1633]|nr:hypothetical protein GGR54DRAFT_146443 [Hypoxylon sp. NC1633]